MQNCRVGKIYKKENMTKKEKSMNMHKFFCLMSLLLETLDDIKATNPGMVELKDNLTAMCELLNEECKDTYTVQKTTYFQGICNKINTVMRKEFNSEM